jgi:hypothetical protein
MGPSTLVVFPRQVLHLIVDGHYFHHLRDFSRFDDFELRSVILKPNS